MAGAGFRALLAGRPLPTPVVAFGIRHLECVAGVVVTASHNPPQDNGYKVYLGDGSQIVPPADAEIAARIEEIAKHELADVPRAERVHRARRRTGRGLPDPDREPRPTGGPARAELGVHPSARGRRGTVVEAAVARAGFARGRGRSEQADARPGLPDRRASRIPRSRERSTSPSSSAAGMDADLVIANDPDADRCAVAVPVAGSWRMLRGDELGRTARRRCAAAGGVQGTYACSVVSSTLLEPMARSLRAAVRHHADRVQVDRPGAGSGLRVRGGDRLLRRSGGRARQGRYLDAGHRAAARGRAEGGRAPPWPTGWT